MVLLSITLHESDPRRGSSADCSLFILSLHALALHLAVKIFKSFCMKIWARWPYIHLSVVFPSRMPAGPHFVTQPILLSEKTFLIFDINHQQTQGGQTRLNDKNDNANYAPVSHGRFYQWLRLPFLKKYSIKCERFRLWIVLFWTKTSQRQALYLNWTDNIHIVLENDNTVLIKGLKKVVNVKFSRNMHLIETSYDRLKSREITFQQYRENLLKQEFSDGLQISMNIKDIAHTFDNSLLFTESIQNTTQIFPR